MEYIKKYWLKALVILALGLLAREVMDKFIQWQFTDIQAEGNQIAKRLENTEYGDRFYLILDSQYGIIEILVSYNQYLAMRKCIPLELS